MLVRAGGRENAAGNLFLSRTGSVAGPREGNSSIRATVLQVSVQNITAKSWYIILIWPRQLYLKNLTFPKLYFTLTLCLIEMLVFANRCIGLGCLFLLAIHFSIDSSERAWTERVLWRLLERSLL